MNLEGKLFKQTALLMQKLCEGDDYNTMAWKCPKEELPLGSRGGEEIPSGCILDLSLLQMQKY